jgi:DNA-binding ferritin-like protein
VGRAATTARAASRIGRERADVERAEERVADLQQQLQALSDEFEDSVAEIETPVDPAAIELEEKTIRPRKSDLEVEPVALVWTPWAVSPEGTAEPAY